MKYNWEQDDWLRFRYEESEFEEVFPVRIYPAVYTKEEMLMRSIQEALEIQNQKSRTDTAMVLPQEIGEKKIIWREVMQDSSGYFFLFMCIAAVFVFFSKKRILFEIPFSTAVKSLFPIFIWSKASTSEASLSVMEKSFSVGDFAIIVIFLPCRKRIDFEPVSLRLTSPSPCRAMICPF